MYKFFGVIFIIGALMSFRKREEIAEMFGEAEWMEHIGGVHNFVVWFIIGIFFLGVAFLTGTQLILLAPAIWLLEPFA